MSTVTGAPASGSAPRGRAGGGWSAYEQRHPRLRLAGLVSAPVGWLVVIYLGSLFFLLLQAFWTVDSFTGEVDHTFTLANFQRIFTESVYRTITLRTVEVAAAVTVVCVVLGLPMAFFMAKVASARAQRWLVIAILAPLWASYLIKAYAWRGMLANGGVLEWLGLPTPGFGLTATVIVLAYLWLPYMVLPIYAGLERLPDSLLDASGDLGAHPWRTFRSVVLPMVMPSVIAGTVFTFSLSLGDYIAVQLVGGTTQMLGNAIYANVGAANNLPFAAALSFVSVGIIVVYLLLVRRSGALREL